LRLNAAETTCIFPEFAKKKEEAFYAKWPLRVKLFRNRMLGPPVA
jgi:hypothetical protein